MGLHQPGRDESGVTGALIQGSRFATTSLLFNRFASCELSFSVGFNIAPYLAHLTLLWCGVDRGPKTLGSVTSCSLSFTLRSHSSPILPPAPFSPSPSILVADLLPRCCCFS